MAEMRKPVSCRGVSVPTPLVPPSPRHCFSKRASPVAQTGPVMEPAYSPVGSHQTAAPGCSGPTQKSSSLAWFNPAFAPMRSTPGRFFRERIWKPGFHGTHFENSLRAITGLGLEEGRGGSGMGWDLNGRNSGRH